MTVALEMRPSPRLSYSPVAEHLVEVEGLRKRFAGERGWRSLLVRRGAREYVQAVRDVSLSVRSGEIFGLLGPNGAGKSTLFRLLATLVLPDAGRVRVGGWDVVQDAARVRELVAMVVPEERSLNWRLSARENLHFFAALYGFAGNERRRRIDEVLEIMQLGEAGERRVASFSSGMRQRLLIARALLPRPQLLLLDEPTRSLDPIAARRFREFLRDEVAVRLGRTILLATHSAEEALELCDRVAILDRGRVVAEGEPRQLATQLGYDRYEVWTRTPEHGAFAALAEDGVIVDSVRLADRDGWGVRAFVIVDEPAHAAGVLAQLVRAGVDVARFEKVRPALADLIEQALHRARDGERDA